MGVLLCLLECCSLLLLLPVNQEIIKGVYWENSRLHWQCWTVDHSSGWSVQSSHHCQAECHQCSRGKNIFSLTRFKWFVSGYWRLNLGHSTQHLCWLQQEKSPGSERDSLILNDVDDPLPHCTTATQTFKIPEINLSFVVFKFKICVIKLSWESFSHEADFYVLSTFVFINLRLFLEFVKNHGGTNLELFMWEYSAVWTRLREISWY